MSNHDHVISMRLEMRTKFIDSVSSVQCTYIHPLADPQDIAAFELSGIRDSLDGSMLREHVSRRFDFASSTDGAGIGEYRQFRDHDSRVLDEDGIGLMIELRKFMHIAPHVPQGLYVEIMLCPGDGEIDRLMFHVGEFAVVDRGTDVSDKGDWHGAIP